ncbi:MAG TPA: hypothetical protein VNL37_02245, partial [Candidatus Polarisedimenticolia bacterium]|nr:hypothetical protein [Candidatus Polarisedimenticolia bacterium]
GTSVDLEPLLRQLADKAKVYQDLALKFVCTETVRSTDDPKSLRQYDYMYVEAEAQRYRPYRQKHTGRPGKGAQESPVEMQFPDSYSWTLMFAGDRQHLFHFRYVGKEWFSLRLAHVIEFTAPLPFNNGQTIYEWSGKVWVDAENLNFLKVEAEPGHQDERLEQELRAYRQAPRFLIFPMAKRPTGSSYNITFLNEFQKLSLPDQARYRVFSLNLEGQEEWVDQLVLRYDDYHFFGVEVRDKFLKR